MVSGCRKKQKRVAAPARAVCSQKMSRQERNVTIMPPMKGPRAGPMRVPLRNQPRAVARSVCVGVSREGDGGEGVGGVVCESVIWTYHTQLSKSTWKSPSMFRKGYTYRFIYIPNNRTPNNKESRALKRSENPKHEETRQIRGQRRPNRKRSKQRSAHNADPLPAVDITIRTIETRRQPHEKHVQSVGNVDNRAIGIKRVRNFRNSRKHRRARDRSQETAKRDYGYNDHLAALGELVVDDVVVAGRNVLDVGHVMVADGRDCALELETVLVVIVGP